MHASPLVGTWRADLAPADYQEPVSSRAPAGGGVVHRAQLCGPPGARPSHGKCANDRSTVLFPREGRLYWAGLYTIEEGYFCYCFDPILYITLMHVDFLALIALQNMQQIHEERATNEYV